MIRNNTALLHPVLKERIDAGKRVLKEKGIVLYEFETYRDSARQNDLYESGRLKGGAIVTNARAGQSLHNYGLACDLVFKDDKGEWTWAGDYETAGKIWVAQGLEWSPNDKPHVEIMAGMTLKDIQAVTNRDGLLTLWDTVDKYYRGKNVSVTH